MGRERDFTLFHLGYPRVSARYNAIGHFSRITEVATRIANQLPSEGNSAAFKEFAWRFVNIIARALVALGRRPDYQQVRRYITISPGEKWDARSAPEGRAPGIAHVNTSSRSSSSTPGSIYAVTAELLTDQLPPVEVLSLMSVSGVDDSSDPDSGVDFRSRNEDRISASEVPMLAPADRVTLPKGHAFALLEGGQLLKLRIPLPDPRGDPLMPESLAEVSAPMERVYATPDPGHRVPDTWWRSASDLPEGRARAPGDG